MQKKPALLAEYVAADSDGKGALLRREAVYTSHISQWRQQRERGTLTGPSRKRESAEPVELEKLPWRNEKLAKELAKTQLAMENAFGSPPGSRSTRPWIVSTPG